MLLGSLLIFAALSVASWVLYDQAEQRLLEERTGEAAQVLTVAVSNLQAPVAAAATIAEVSDGNPDAFRAAMAAQVQLYRALNEAEKPEERNQMLAKAAALYERARYDLSLDYTQPPVPPLREDDVAWTRELVDAEST